MSQTPSLKRKQQPSISSFFGKASSPPSSNGVVAKKATENGRGPTVSSSQSELGCKLGHNGGATNREDVNGDDEDDIVLPSRKRIRRKDDRNEDKEDKEDDGNPAINGANGRSHREISTRITKETASSRTERFRFQSSPVDENNTVTRVLDEVDPVDTKEVEKERKRKAQLHQKFVRRLGGPDCLPSVGRMDETGMAESEGDEDEPAPAPKGRSSKKAGGSKLTPMERQILDIKRNHLDAILVFQVGYKFQFFGEDARIAAKELSIVCIPGKFRYDEHPSEAHLNRFASASFPLHRLHVHVKRLVAADHKVGVVRQLETAALKAAGDNKSAPFVRKLTNMYTKGTYVIDDKEDLGGAIGNSTPSTGYVLCLTESNAKGIGNDEKVQVGIVAVQPATGSVIYDNFEDGFMRSEIETRLLHIAPCELILVGDLSTATNKLVGHLSRNKMTVFGDSVRVERVPKSKSAGAEAHSHVSSFYAGRMTATGTADDEKASSLLDKVLHLPNDVTICLSAMIKHLSESGLEHVFELMKYFQSFSARSHMLLNGNTLINLEIYQNQTDHTAKGSLFWTLDRTKTRFGQRLLRKWVGRPLLEKLQLEQRVAAVEELLDPDRADMVDRLNRLLSRIKIDLEKVLIRVYYGRCTRPELLNMLQTLQQIASEFAGVKSPAEAGFTSQILNDSIAVLPTMLKDVIAHLDKINAHAAKKDDKYDFFRETEESEEITGHRLSIIAVEHDLRQHRTSIAETLGKKKVDYVTVAGIEYLIEVENIPYNLKKVPASWRKISGTKKVSRFHTPDVVSLMRERDQQKESLAAACDKAFSSLLAQISSQYHLFRDCIQALAMLDSLLSLSAIAGQPGYVKPTYTDDTKISVEKGRHPMVEQLLLDSYVPNDTELSTDETRALLVTGPNMGGKSSYVRQIALITIMGQIGSYVPAASAKLGMLDAVFTRMGAFDNMLAGESTFMVELSETADILKQATPRSLVILDELGRGTSTHDGVAIAQSVLDYMVRNLRSLTLFITHYQHLSRLALGFPNGELRNVHMKFTESGRSGQDITFLYEVGEGVAHRSYGLNVARLANIPSSILAVAQTKSAELEAKIARKKMAGVLSGVSKLLSSGQVEEANADSDASVGRLLNDVSQL